LVSRSRGCPCCTPADTTGCCAVSLHHDASFFPASRLLAAIGAVENLSRTARATSQRCQPVLFSMVESDLISPVEHHLVAPRFAGTLYKHRTPNERWRADSVRDHLIHVRRHYGAV